MIFDWKFYEDIWKCCKIETVVNRTGCIESFNAIVFAECVLKLSNIRAQTSSSFLSTCFADSSRQIKQI